MTWLSWWFNSLPTVCAKEELGVQAPVGFWVSWKDLEVEKCHDWNWQAHDKLVISQGNLVKMPWQCRLFSVFSKLPSKWFIWMLFLGLLKTLTLKWWSCNAQRIYHNLPTWPLFAIHQCDIPDILIQDICSVKLKSLDPLPMIHLSSFHESLCFRQPLTASGRGPNLQWKPW